MSLRKFIQTTIREYLIESYNNDYYILYHGTDSDFFDKLDFNKAKKKVKDIIIHLGMGYI